MVKSLMLTLHDWTRTCVRPRDLRTPRIRVLSPTALSCLIGQKEENIASQPCQYATLQGNWLGCMSPTAMAPSPSEFSSVAVQATNRLVFHGISPSRNEHINHALELLWPSDYFQGSAYWSGDRRRASDSSPELRSSSGNLGLSTETHFYRCMRSQGL